MRNLCAVLGLVVACTYACDGEVNDRSARERDAAAEDAGGGDSGPIRGPVTANQSCETPSPAFTAEEQRLVDLPADSWFSVPDSKIRPLCPEGGENCGNVIDAWSGGTFDPIRSQMLVFGGGHGDYWGNEVYAFKLASLTWERLTDPSPEMYMNQDPLPDGRPASRHTYDGIAYIEHADRMFAHGGSRWQDGSGTNVTWAFDPEAGTWENREPNELPLANCCDESSVYDPATRRVYAHWTKFLAAYDWDDNTWTILQDYGEPPYWPRYEVWGDKRAALDVKRGLVWFFGAGIALVYDIANAAHVTDDWVTTGGSMFSNEEQIGSHSEQLFVTGGGEIVRGKGPGVDYDTAADAMVGWVGGAPWILDLTTKTWRRSAADGGPDEPSINGTYGRFRYVARLNVFVLVNSVDEDVHVYKHTAGCGR